MRKKNILTLCVKSCFLPIHMLNHIALLFRHRSNLIDRAFIIFRNSYIAEMSKVTDQLFHHKNKQYGNKLTYLDIGASGGVSAYVRNNFEKLIVCEGEKNEVEKLRKSGAIVIEAFLSDAAKKTNFYYVNKHPYASSLKKPGTIFLNLFSSRHYELYTDFSKSSIYTSTLDDELAKLNISRVDYLKIDIQGSEYDVLKGLNNVRPLFIEVENLPFPTYVDAPYGVEITKVLIEKGYMCLRRKNRRYNNGMLVFSDEIYMPDYSKQSGLDLINQNFYQWSEIMVMLDVEDLAKHIKNYTSIG